MKTWPKGLQPGEGKGWEQEHRDAMVLWGLAGGQQQNWVCASQICALLLARMELCCQPPNDPKDSWWYQAVTACSGADSPQQGHLSSLRAWAMMGKSLPLFSLLSPSVLGLVFPQELCLLWCSEPHRPFTLCVEGNNHHGMSSYQQ